MDVSRKRGGVKSNVVAGSVWESRMKLDEVKGGIKVFNGEENRVEGTAEDGASSAARKLVKKGQSPVASSGKRKTWKSESFDGPIQIAKGKTCEQQSRELSASVDGIKKCPIQGRKGRSEVVRELSMSVDGIDVKSPIQVKKGRSEGSREVNVSVDGIAKSPIQAKKGRSEVNKEVAASVNGSEKSPIQTRKLRSDVKEVVEYNEPLRKVKSDSVKVVRESGKDVAVDDAGSERNSGELGRAKSEPGKILDESIYEIEEIEREQNLKEFGLCQESIIPSGSETNNDVLDHDDEFEGDEEEEEEEEEIDAEVDIEVEIEKKSFDIKEITTAEEKSKGGEPNAAEEKPKKVEVIIPEVKPKKVEISIPEHKPKKIVNEERKVHHLSNRISPTSSTVNKQPPPVFRRATIYQNLAKTAPIPAANECRQSFPETHSKLQNLVDLVMWRDISRSAFVFGIGTFIIISSSCMKDLNVSFISVISYLGLVYLAAIFLYRSLICRGLVELDDNRSYVVGQEEAIWLLKLILPYLNECLLKIRALFSGDPATTMKMAVLLFVFARCGSSITIWKMAKLGFFGVFIVPKVCTSYSPQLTAYGKFWIRRFRDAWDSCTHKKAVALAIFTLVWNLSSMVARIWAVFMMFVAVRYHQQTMEREDWEDDRGAEATWHAHTNTGVNGPNTDTAAQVNKVKKTF